MSHRQKAAMAMVLAAIVAFAGAAQAINIDFDDGFAGDSDWNSAQNWTGDTLPGLSDNAFIRDQIAGNVTIDVTSTTPVFNELCVARDLPGNVVINHTGGTLENRSWFNIGQGFGGATHTGTYIMSGNAVVLATHAAGGQTALGAFTGGGGVKGTLILNDNAQFIQSTNDLRIGGEGVGAQFNADGELTLNGNSLFDKQGGGLTLVGRQGTGTINVNDTATFNTTGLYMGEGGTGIVNQNGGTVTVTSGGDTTRIGTNAGGTGIYNIAAGTLNASNLQVGFYGTGDLNASGTGQVNVGGWFVAGRQVGGIGTISLSDAAVANATNSGTIIGELGDGTLNVADSATLNTNELRVGFRNASNGTITQTGGTLTVLGGGDDTRIGHDAGSNGVVDITGGAFNVSNGALQIGWYGTGEVNVGGTGQLTVRRWLVTGRQNTGVGTLTLRDNAVVTEQDTATIVGEQNLGTLNVHDNALLDTAALWVGLAGPGVGVVNQTGGTIDIRAGGGYHPDYEVGRDGIGTVNQSGGTVSVAGDLYIRPGSTYNQSGGTVTVAEQTFLWGTAADPGQLVLSGNAQYINNSYMCVGHRNGDYGELTVRDNATLTASGGFNVSDQAGSTGTLTLDGGLVTGSVVFIGKSGGTLGTVHQTGGELHSNSYMCIGTAGGSVGEYHLGGGTLWADGDLNVSDQGGSTGTVYLDGGLARGNTVYIGKGADTVGTVYQTGGQLTSAASMRMGYGNNSLGTLEMSGTAQVNVGSYLCIGTAPGSTGIVRMSDSAQLLVNGDLNVSDQGGSTGALYLDGGLAQGGNVFVGKSANTLGTVVQNGGQMVANGDLYIAWDGAATGNYTLNGGEIIVNGGVMRVGSNGTATLTQTGGSIRTNNWFVIGQGGSNTSTYNMSGGTLDVNVNGGGERLQIGVWDTVHGQMNLSGTAQVVVHSSETQVGGDHATATGGLTVSDFAQLHTPMLRVGRPGQGQLTQTGGLIVTTLNPQIGAYGPGTFDQSGGLFYHVRHMAVSRYAGSEGTYNMSGGINAGRWMILAEDGGTDGEMNVSGGAMVSLGGSAATSPSLEVARDGLGVVNQTGGMVYADTATIASGASGNGTYNLGGGVLETRNLSMGPGTAAFNFTGGALRVGTVAFSLNNQGGTLDVCTPMTAGWNVAWHDGNDMTDNPGAWAPGAPHSTEIVDAVEYGGGAPAGGYPGGSADYYGAVYTASLYAPGAGMYAFRERVDDASYLTIDGVPVLWDYTAASDMGEPTGNPWEVHSFTTVGLAAGWHTLEFRWSDHWGGQNAYLEWDPAGGQNWSLLVGGAVFADTGSEVGTATILGDYVQGAGGTLAIDIGGYGAGTEFDVVDITGLADLAGMLDVALIGGFEPVLTDEFTILDAGQLVGTFDTIDTSDALFSNPAMGWKALYDYEAGTVTLRVVPEPATLALLGLGGLALLRRRRRT